MGIIQGGVLLQIFKMKNKILRHIRAVIFIILFCWYYLIRWIFNYRSMYSMVKSDYKDVVGVRKKHKKK